MYPVYLCSGSKYLSSLGSEAVLSGQHDNKMLLSIKKVTLNESAICYGDFVVIQSADSKVLCRHENGTLFWDEEFNTIFSLIKDFHDKKKQDLDEVHENKQNTSDQYDQFFPPFSDIFTLNAQEKFTQSVFQMKNLQNISRSESEVKLASKTHNKSESNLHEKGELIQNNVPMKSTISINDNFKLQFSSVNWIDFTHITDNSTSNHNDEFILYASNIQNDIQCDELLWTSQKTASELCIAELMFSFEPPSISSNSGNTQECNDQAQKNQDENTSLDDNQGQEVTELPEIVEIDINFAPGKLGVAMSPLKAHEKLGGIYAPVIIRLLPDSQALSNGIQVGDMIRAINDKDFRSTSFDSKIKWQSFIEMIVGESRQHKQVIVTVARPVDSSVRLFIEQSEKSPQETKQENYSHNQALVLDSNVVNETPSSTPSKEEILIPAIHSEKKNDEVNIEQTNVKTEVIDSNQKVGQSHSLLSNLADLLCFESQALLDKVITSDPSRIIKRQDTLMQYIGVKPSRFSFSKKIKYSWEFRHLILCNDVLLVTMLGADNKLVVEVVVWLLNCKIDVQDVIEIESKDQKLVPNSCKIISPYFKDNEGSILLKWETCHEKSEWIRSISECLKDTLKNTALGNMKGWQHQVILGTVYSFVVNNDVAGLEQYITFEKMQEEQKYSNSSNDSDLNSQSNLIESLNVKDDDGFTPLHYAASNKEGWKMLLKLISIGADPFIADKDGMLPIHHAAFQLNQQVLEILLSIQNMDVDVRDNRGRTPFYLVANSSSLSMEENYLDPFSSCLTILKLHHADFDMEDDEGFSILHRLILQGDNSKLKILLAHDLDLHRTITSDHLTPLHLSVHPKFVNNVDPSIIETLLKSGIQPNRRDIDGKTALHLLTLTPNSLWQSNPKITAAFKVMLDFGARVDIEDADDVTPRQLLQGKNINLDLNEMMKAWKDSKQQRMEAVYTFCNLNKNSVWKGLKLENPDPTRCFLCEEKFPFFAGKHTCRLCGALVCHNCSGDCKICDGCFSRKYYESILYAPQPTQDIIYTNRFDDSALLKQNEAKKKEEMKRNELFQNASISSTPKSQTQNSAIHSVHTSTSDVKDVMHQNLDQLSERGEKLRNLETKTADMANAAKEFERMCRELNNQSQRSKWF